MHRSVSAVGMWFHSFSVPLVGLLLLGAAHEALAADRLILRNLDLVRGRTVAAFDEDGVVLDAALADGSSRLTWDQIERGKVALDQARFNGLLAELGLPLFRVRQRLKIGDVRGAGEVAESLYGRFAERKGSSAFLICQAVLWSRLGSGRSEEAVEPALRCVELLRSKAASVAELPGVRRPKFDLETGLAAELPPVWLDGAAAKSVLPKVEQAIRGMAQPRPVGAYLYYATLAVAAGETAEAERVLPLVATHSNAAALGDLVRAQQEMISGRGGAAVERLRSSRGGLPIACQSAASFVLGRADLQTADADRQRDGLLELLTIAAGRSDEQRELTAAALYHAAGGLDKLKDVAGAAAVRAELAGRFVDTKFGVESGGVRKK